MKAYFLMLLSAGAFFAAIPAASQAAPIYSFTSAPIQFGEAPLTIGFVFTANTSITIDSLGFFDANQNGLHTSHEVGIFDSNGILLTSALVPSGSVGVLDGQFRYTAIPSFTLNSGQSYTIAGQTTGLDGYTYGHIGSDIQGLTVDPAISIDSQAGRFNYGASLAYPTSNFAGYLYPVVNFGSSSLVPVPIPATLPLFGAGLVSLIALRRKQSQVKISH